MKNKTVKTHMQRLLNQLGDRQGVANALGISERYVRNLEKGEKIPSDQLRKLIKLVLK